MPSTSRGPHAPPRHRAPAARAAAAMQHISVECPPGRAWALVLIAKEPVNSFDRELWAALRDTIRGLEADASVRGVVLASGLKRDVFTAGNDLKELYAPNTSAERCAVAAVAGAVAAGGPAAAAGAARARPAASRGVRRPPLRPAAEASGRARTLARPWARTGPKRLALQLPAGRSLLFRALLPSTHSPPSPGRVLQQVPRLLAGAEQPAGGPLRQPPRDRRRDPRRVPRGRLRHLALLRCALHDAKRQHGTQRGAQRRARGWPRAAVVCSDSNAGRRALQEAASWLLRERFATAARTARLRRRQQPSTAHRHSTL